jgi:hypothetical protein
MYPVECRRESLALFDSGKQQRMGVEYFRQTDCLAVPVLVLECLLPTLPALGGLLLLPQNARLLIEASATNFGEHAILLDLLVETLQRAFEGLVPVNRYVRHPLSPLSSQW